MLGCMHPLFMTGYAMQTTAHVPENRHASAQWVGHLQSRKQQSDMLDVASHVCGQQQVLVNSLGSNLGDDEPFRHFPYGVTLPL